VSSSQLPLSSIEQNSVNEDDDFIPQSVKRN